MMPMTRIDELLGRLHDGGVRFVIIGGVAMTLRGSTRTTIDVDVCYAREPEDLRRLAAALAPLHPRLRGAPEGLPFLWDERTLKSGLNFTLTTDLGDIDLLGEVPGLGLFAAVDAAASDLDVGGRMLRVLDLDGLERSKRAAGRVKDLMDLAELASIRARRGA
jgi:hypothetical protein